MFKEADLPSFQRLLSSNMIQLVDTKKDNLQQRDIARYYLSGYYKELAHAAIRDLPTSIITNIDQGCNVSEAKISQCSNTEAVGL
jgi:hypothetical protein